MLIMRRCENEDFQILKQGKVFPIYEKPIDETQFVTPPVAFGDTPLGEGGFGGQPTGLTLSFAPHGGRLWRSAHRADAQLRASWRVASAMFHRGTARLAFIGRAMEFVLDNRYT